MKKPPDWLEWQKNEWNLKVGRYSDLLEMVRRPDGGEVDILVNSVIEILGLSEKDEILEVGCGNGALYPRLARIILVRYVGVDMALELLKVGTRRVGQSFVAGEASALPILDNSFNYVLCAGVAMLFPGMNYMLRVIEELLRVCRPSGRILITDIPDIRRRDHMRIFLKRIYHRFQERFLGYHYEPGESEYYWEFYDMDVIQSFLRNKGYESVVHRKHHDLFNHRFAVDLSISCVRIAR